VNSLGFRDREFSVQKKVGYRIVAIGDSFTFGWGVNIEATWVKLLEDHLRKSGHDVEIANLGKGGSYPKLYADLAERAIPILKPNLVLVAILQGDDLAQGGEEARWPDRSIQSRFNISTLRATVSRTVRALYPNLMALVRPVKEAVEGTEVPTETWQKQTAELLGMVGETGKAKFDSLDGTVKRLYIDGKLNPGLLGIAIRAPRRMAATMELDNPTTQALIVEMGNQLSRIRRVAARHNADVLVVPVPYRVYVNKRDLEQVRSLGFVMSEDMLNSTAPDDAILLACEQAGLRFRSVTEAFRRRAQPGIYTLNSMGILIEMGMLYSLNYWSQLWRALRSRIVE
jgi:hypothetical protein